MKYLTVEEFAKSIGLSARSVRNYCVQGRIEGAYLKGKTWFIPENANKPERSGKDFLNQEELKNARGLIEFINDSPNAFFAVENVKKELLANGYKECFEHSPNKVNPGDKVFFIRNGTSLVALNIGNKVNNSTLNIDF